MLTEEQLYDLLENAKPATKNNLVADCPFCNKKEHFFINKGLNSRNRLHAWDCKKCGENGTIYSLLYRLDKTELLSKQKVDIFDKLGASITDNLNEIEEIDFQTKPIKMPVGYKRVFVDEYLLDRGFNEQDFTYYEVGRTKLVDKLDNYIIFPIRDEKLIKGYVSRVRLNKQQIKQQEAEQSKKILRYNNSKFVDFSKLLYGYDEINFMTKKVILVEGVFAKIRVDKILDLNRTDEIKCLATFGKKVSDYQIMKLLFKNIEKVTLMFDEDAVNTSKDYLKKLSRHFSEVSSVYTHSDIDDMPSEDIIKCINNEMHYTDFLISKVEIKRLL